MQIITLVMTLIAALGLYPRAGYVCELDRENDTVIIEDASGFLWEIEEIEDWCVGDGCAMIMYDNGTPEVFDDAIVSIRYNGFVR